MILYGIPIKGIQLVVAFPFPVQLKHGKWADDGVSEPPFKVELFSCDSKVVRNGSCCKLQYTNVTERWEVAFITTEACLLSAELLVKEAAFYQSQEEKPKSAPARTHIHSFS